MAMNGRCVRCRAARTARLPSRTRTQAPTHTRLRRAGAWRREKWVGEHEQEQEQEQEEEKCKDTSPGQTRDMARSGAVHPHDATSLRWTCP